MLTEFLLDFTLIGAEWILWILMFLSLLSVGVSIERGVFYGRDGRVDHPGLLQHLRSSNHEEALTLLADKRGFVAEVVRAGLEHLDKGPEAVESILASEMARVRSQYDRFLAILATIGSNAPFIGLFGTCLGIIRAFADLAAAGGTGGPDVVMAGISEALVATAVGLGVAIPAVIMFNVFARWQRRLGQKATSAGQALLAGIKARPPGDGGSRAEQPTAAAS